MTASESLGVVSGALAIWLIARASWWGWPISLLSSAVYGVVFFDAKLYADTGLQACYVVLSAYGWFAWWRGDRSLGPGISIHRAPARSLSVALAAGSGGSLVLYLLLRQTDAALPWLDAPTAAFSLVGQWMQARKWIQNWPLWIVVDLVYVGLYIQRALYLTAGLYLVFAAIAVMGWLAWLRILDTQASPRAS